MTTNFSDQVQLLVQLLPLVAKQPCFALKGGTAINNFFGHFSKKPPGKRYS